MQLRNVMTRDVEVVRPDASVQEAAATMKRLDVAPLPVCDGKRVLGMVTDRDITIRAVAEGRDPKATTVQEVMTDEVIYCYEDQDAEDATRLMAEKQVRRLLVLDRDKQLVGIVSLGDLAVDTADPIRAGETLERVSQPAEPER